MHNFTYITWNKYIYSLKISHHTLSCSWKWTGSDGFLSSKQRKNSPELCKYFGADVCHVVENPALHFMSFSVIQLKKLNNI